MWTVEYWRHTAELAVRGAAHMALAAGLADGTTLWDLDWWHILGAAGLGAVLSLVTSILAEPSGDPGTPLGLRRRPRARPRRARDEDGGAS